MNENDFEKMIKAKADKIEIKTTSSMILDRFLNQSNETIAEEKKSKSWTLKPWAFGVLACSFIGLAFGGYFVGDKLLTRDATSTSTTVAGGLEGETAFQVYNGISIIDSVDLADNSSLNTLKQKTNKSYREDDENQYYGGHSFYLNETQFLDVAQTYNNIDSSLQQVIKNEMQVSNEIDYGKGAFSGKFGLGYNYRMNFDKIDKNVNFLFSTYANSSTNTSTIYLDGEIEYAKTSTNIVSYRCYAEFKNEANDTQMSLFGHDHYEWDEEDPWAPWGDHLDEFEDKVNVDMKIYLSDDDSSYLQMTQTSNAFESEYEYTIYVNDDEVYSEVISFEKLHSFLLINVEVEKDDQEYVFEVQPEISERRRARIDFYAYDHIGYMFLEREDDTNNYYYMSMFVSFPNLQ